MSITCRRIIENTSETPLFYKYTAIDVDWNGLKYYSRKRNRRESDPNEYLSETAIRVHLHNNKVRGIRIPNKIVDGFNAIKMKNQSKWVLGFHNIKKDNFLCFFPYHNTHKNNYIEVMNFSFIRIREGDNDDYHFRADEIFIWPELITANLEVKNRDGYLFDIPDLFLKVSSYEKNNVELLFYADCDGSNEIKYYIEHPIFNIFYDLEGNVLLFSNRFRRKDKHLGPDFIRQPEGCKWKNYDALMKDITKTEERTSPEEWLSDKL